jgi:DsbC/DsbD-like thiol-disulfide interchange protein
MRRLLALFSWLLFIPVAAAPQESAMPPASAVVKPLAYVSLEPVPRGRTFELAVVAEIRQGFHINSHQPTEEFLIPTTLTAQLPSGFREVGTVYPRGEMLKFSFSPSPLSVYTGRVTLIVRVEAAADAPLGPQSIPLSLRYQACNDTTCLPPVKIPVEAKFTVAPASTPAKNIHPEIFSVAKSQPKK